MGDVDRGWGAGVKLGSVVFAVRVEVRDFLLGCLTTRRVLVRRVAARMSPASVAERPLSEAARRWIECGSEAGAVSLSESSLEEEDVSSTSCFPLFCIEENMVSGEGLPPAAGALPRRPTRAS